MQHKRRTDGAAAGAAEQVPARPESDVVEELETPARITETSCFAANMPDAHAGDDKDERRRKTNGSASRPTFLLMYVLLVFLCTSCSCQNEGSTSGSIV